MKHFSHFKVDWSNNLDLIHWNYSCVACNVFFFLFLSTICGKNIVCFFSLFCLEYFALLVFPLYFTHTKKMQFYSIVRFKKMYVSFVDNEMKIYLFKMVVVSFPILVWRKIRVGSGEQLLLWEVNLLERMRVNPS